MAFTLDDRAALRRAFYRLTDSSSDDASLEEHDSEENEAVHYYLQHGLWEAQGWVISSGDPFRWQTRSAALSWSGSDSADGGRYTDLPADFLRMAGREEVSALREANGRSWGTLLVDVERRFDIRGSYYYLLGDELWIASGAQPPSTLYLHYHERHAVLETDETEIDFPLLDRPLIVAFAGQMAVEDAWVAGGEEMERKVHRNLELWKRRVAARARRTHEPQRLRPRDTPGNHWFV